MNIDWDKIEKSFKYSISRGKNYNIGICDTNKIIAFFKQKVEKQLKCQD